MEITNENNASNAGDIASGPIDTTVLDATATSATAGYATQSALGGDESINYGDTEGKDVDDAGANIATTSASYGTNLSDGVQTSGDQKSNNVEALNIRGSDVGGTDG